MKWIAGADPGKKGAIVLLNAEVTVGNFKKEDVICFPTKVDDLGRIDTDTIYDNLKPYLKNIVLYIQEDIHSIFGASACSNFNFGDSNGSLRAAVQVALRSANNKNCKFALVQPKIWQKNAWKKDEIIAEPYIDKTTGKPKLLSSGKVRMNTDTKQTSMNAAHRLFPETTFVMPRCRKEHDGCVDAALIALYGHKILNAAQNQG